jgi:glycosyltransferase involved in cell wall biosynthesis
VKVILACNFERDERLGSSRTPLRLEPELRALGLDVRGVYAADLPAAPGVRGAVLSAPLRVAAALRKLARDADVVDIAGGDGFAYFAYARLARPQQALVARSNGLWDLALAGEGFRDRGALRNVASKLYQKHVICRWEQQSIRAADMAVFLSNWDAQEVVRRGWRHSEGVAAVNPGVDPFFTAENAVGPRRDVVFVGTFYHRKGRDIVVAVMARLLAEQPSLGLTLCGVGMPAEQALSFFDAPLRSRVTVFKSLAPDELARKLASFAVFLFPTRYEGFGIVTLEAMRAGVAVVTTPTGAGADVVRDGENGLLVPIGDAEATYRAVRRLLDDEQLRERLAARGKTDVEQRSWQRAARELLGVYELACARRSRQR